MNMKEYEKIQIETMELVLLNRYNAIIKEQSFAKQTLLRTEKDAMITTLSIMGYMVTIDVDTDLRVTAVHVRKV